MSDLLKRGSTYFPVFDKENPNEKPSFARSGGTKLQFKDGTTVVYMPQRMTKQYGKPVIRDATISVKYKWGQKTEAMSLRKFATSFGEGFVVKVFQLLFQQED